MDNDTDLANTITTLSREYNDYKGAYVFPTRFKSKQDGSNNEIFSDIFLSLYFRV